MKQWKLSPMDLESRRRWEDTRAKEEMLARTTSGGALVGRRRTTASARRGSTASIILLLQVPYRDVEHQPIVLPAREHKPTIIHPGARRAVRPGGLLMDAVEPRLALAVAFDDPPARLRDVGARQHLLLGPCVFLQRRRDSRSMGESFHCFIGSWMRIRSAGSARGR